LLNWELVVGHDPCTLQIPSDQCAAIVRGDDHHGSGSSPFVRPVPGGGRYTGGDDVTRGLPGKRGMTGEKGEKGDQSEVDQKTLAEVLIRLGELEAKMNSTEQDLIVKQGVIEELQLKLEETSAKADRSIKALEDYKAGLIEKERKSIKPKSCAEVPTKKNGVYTIQPKKSLPPFKVSCYFQGNTVITSVRHNSEDEIAVSPKCDEPRCYKRAIEYNDVTMEQMRALIEHVGKCRQYVSYRCQGSALFRWGHAGWESWDGRMQNYWGGSNGQSGFCGCGVTRSCVAPQYKCNCDANAMIEQEDSGYLNKQDDLPVKTLYFGDAKQAGEYGFHTLGALQCMG